MLTKAILIFGVFFFAMAVYVQLNDPDPLVWGTIYGVVWLANLAALLNRLSRQVAGVLVLPYFAFAIWMSPYLLHTTVAAFKTMGMQNLEDELVRESWGAVVCLCWMVGLWLLARHRRPRKFEAASLGEVA